MVRRLLQGAALRGFLVMAASLTGLFGLLQFVGELAFVGQGRYGVGDALLVVLLSAPLRLLQVAPVALLLGSLIALGPLARNTELVALRAIGVSERRVIGTLLELVVPIVLAMLALAELVVPPAQARAQSIRADALAASAAFHVDNTLWAHGDHQYLSVHSFAPDGAPVGIDIYDFADDGRLRRLTHADRAEIGRNDIWQLSGVEIRIVRGFVFETERHAAMPWHAFLPQRQIRLLALPLPAVPPVALVRYVHRLERRGLGAERYRRELWNRIAVPFSMVAMVMIAAPFVFGPPRLSSAGRSLAGGIGVGLGFSLGQQVAGRLGVLLDLGPAVTALAPPLLVIAVASWFLSETVRG